MGSQSSVYKQKYNIDVEQLLNLPMVVYWVNMQSIALGCNDQCAELIELNSRHEYVDSSPYDWYKPEEALAIIKNDSIATKKGEVICAPETITRPKKGQLTLFSIKMPLYDADSIVVGAYGMSINLSASSSTVALSMLNNLGRIANIPVVRNAIYQNFNDISINGIKLSKREAECLFYLSKGKLAKEIAYILDLSPRTIEHYINNIYIKLKCQNRSQLLELIHTQDILKLWMWL